MRVPLKSFLAATLSFLALPIPAQEGSNTAATDPQDQIALDPHALAVLPIEILTDDPRAPSLTAAAYEAVMLELASIEGLYVLQQELVLPYADSSLSPGEIGLRLGVGYVMEWSVEADRFGVLLKAYLRAAPSGSTSGFAHPLEINPDWHYSDPPFDVDALIPDAGHRIAEHVKTTLFPRPAPDPQQALAEARTRVLDMRLSDQERFRALREISTSRARRVDGWRLGRPYGEEVVEALSGAVAVAAADLAINSDDSGLRSGIWFEMAGVSDPYLVQPLLYSLANDSDDNVRRLAARALMGFLDEPGVRDGLSYAHAYDESEAVREEIRFSMLSDTEQQEELRTIPLNTALTDRERSSALGGLLRANNWEPLDAELAVAMVELARNAASPDIRSHVWSVVSQSGDPRLVQPLLDTLKNDPDEHVREAAVNGLTQFLDSPDVRTAIEDTLVSDTSPLVRKRAGESLSSVNR